MATYLDFVCIWRDQKSEKSQCSLQKGLESSLGTLMLLGNFASSPAGKEMPLRCRRGNINTHTRKAEAENECLCHSSCLGYKPTGYHSCPFTSHPAQPSSSTQCSHMAGTLLEACPLRPERYPAEFGDTFFLLFQTVCKLE